MQILVCHFIKLFILRTWAFACPMITNPVSSSKNSKRRTLSNPRRKYAVGGGNFFGSVFKVFFVLLLLAAISAGVVFFLRMNKVPQLDEATKAQWSQVQNQYKRRADLIPNLIAAVKGYATHEKETLMQLTDARANVGKINLTADMVDHPEIMTQYLGAQKTLSSSLGRLMAVAESYPELKASDNFLALQSQLEGSENRISVARRDYIAAVKAYNTELRTIPGKCIADWLYPEASVRETFSATESEQALPKVKF